MIYNKNHDLEKNGHNKIHKLVNQQTEFFEIPTTPSRNDIPAATIRIGLSEYLNDGRLEISNIIAERSIKPFVIDRKNFLFSNTPNGATASAVTFSIIQTAIANNLDPYAYLTYIFTEAPKLAANNEAWVEPILPQNAPDSCKAGNKGRGNV